MFTESFMSDFMNSLALPKQVICSLPHHLSVHLSLTSRSCSLSPASSPVCTRGKKNTMATVKSLYGTDVANGEPSQKVFVQKLCFARQQAASQSPGQDWLHPVMWKCNMFLSNTSKTKTYRMKIFHKAVLSISEHFTILTTGLQSLQ